MNPTLLKDLILAGHRVACKDTDGKRRIFMFIRNDGQFQGTHEDEKITGCIGIGLSSARFSDNEIKEYFTGEYKIVTPLPQLPQVGDTVEVLEICREIPGFDEWGDDMKDMVGGRFRAKSISDFGDIRVYAPLEKDYFSFASRAVAKCEPEKAHGKQSEEQFGDTILFNGKTYKAI